MTQSVTVHRIGSIAVVTIDNPPVNALSFHVREPLYRILTALRDDGGVAGVVIAAAGRTFIAGADIREFERPIEPPTLPDLILLLETFARPTLAALHGSALGGGLELALACHFRVGTENV